MPFGFSVGVGPFRYFRRIGGRRRRSGGVGPATRAAGAGLDRLAERVDAWGEEGERRSRARRVEQGLPPDPPVRSFREMAMPEGSFADMVAARKRRLGRK